MTHARTTASAALLGLALAGCVRPASNLAVVVPTITGHWQSTSGAGELDMTLWVKGTHAGGSGWLREGGGPRSQLAVVGQFVPPAFSLQFMVRDRVAAEYVGRLDSTGTMRGVLRDSGQPTDSLILARLPSRP
jgi:hypothetical protein